jgi:DNA polymerase I-like protein with 3'-5' exonuclease and polymerase domains
MKLDVIDPFADLTAFDVETAGADAARLFALQPFRMRTGDAWLTSCAIAYDLGDGIACEHIREPNAEQLADWLASMAGRYAVCWNAPFDIAWLLVLDELHPHLCIRDKVFAVDWLDGMLLYRHAINAPRYKEEGRMSLGLKEAVAEFFPGEEGYEEGIAFMPTTPEEWDRLLAYNERDCAFTLRITRLLLQTIPVRMKRNAIIEARCLPLVADTMVGGLKVNAARAAALGERLTLRRDAALVMLAMQHGMREWEKIIASPKQLRELLFDTWGLTIIGLTDTGQPSTDKETLTILGLTDERAKLIYEVRENQTRNTKFAKGALDSLAYNGDGYVRPGFRVFGTYTGRGTYSSKQGKGKAEVPTGIAIHQWVNDPEYRALIEVDEDSDLIEADFAGQEYRWMAVESDDPIMLAMCAPGEDAHSFMASQISPALSYEWIRANRDEDPAAKQIRKLGKVGNLSCQYRTGPNTLVKVAAIQHGVRLSAMEATLVVGTYKRTYRRVPVYWARQISFARKFGYVETLAGRRVQLGEVSTWRSNGEDWTWAHESTSINFPIQGIGADQKYLALLVARNYLPTVGGRFVKELHDGMFFRVPKGLGEKASREIKKLLSNLPYRRAWGLDYDLPVKFPVDVKHGPHWGALKELKN